MSLLTLPAAVSAQPYQSFIDHPVRVCDAAAGSDTPPDFEQSLCETTLFYQADPQDRLIWIIFEFEAEPTLVEGDQPLGLFLSAKASSEVFLNGVALGKNGKPGASPLSEDAGDMDAVFFVPEDTLKADTNRLVMRMSSMNGGITLNSPMHNISLAPYRDPRKPGPATWFALVTFGLFVAAFVFFGVSSLRGSDKEGSALIAAISLTAALQLAAEATRDILPYPYPLHDLRLSLILTFAICLGLSAAAYVLLRLFQPFAKRRLLALAGLLAVMLLISVLQPGFDLKTGLVFIAASVVGAIGGVIADLGGNRNGRWIALASLALAASIYWLGGLFLDTVLYLIVAVCVLWLFFSRARAGNLLAEPADIQVLPKRIEISNNGRIEFVDCNDVVRFSGAGDYVEVFLKSGRSALHSATLSALESELSDGFIRVHRSHIVNAELVKSLTRESAGTGELQMSDGSVVPISRRNLASVKAALKSN
ncbi:LytTR family DNA-binding domain-containing protein [Erythrobacter crassostreae]|uniref:LytTR family transcriptional regulator n=1 Tax=Erythrobacter crassostreae TaxID=2828328 RepID=A0A9X1JKK8_9SPHN|nr:LytTR family DNA-binding domain-containing protein [Erythrobacter crassostrea]MBV7259061.1 LytTR family transcriptional regulator [Erythrobacter crassostrea]